MVVILILFAIILVVALIAFFSPKLKGKVVASNIKAVKVATDEAKDDMAGIAANTIDAVKKATDEKKEDIADIRENITGTTDEEEK